MTANMSITDRPSQLDQSITHYNQSITDVNYVCIISGILDLGADLLTPCNRLYKRP